MNKNQFQKYKGMDDLNSLYEFFIFYNFYLTSYFSFIIVRHYELKERYDEELI